MYNGDPEKSAHQIILAHNLATLKFNGILIVNFLKIQSNGEWMINECKIKLDA